MPEHKLIIKPGVDTERTPTLNEGGLNSSRLIRFFSGLPQKVGGWQSLALPRFMGVCRGLMGWADYSGLSYVAVGTNERLYVVDGALSDITPIVATDVSVTISASLGSSTITATDPSRVPDIGDWVIVSTTSVGGIILSGQYQVNDVISTSYTFIGGNAATSTASVGGVTIAYLLPPGFAVNTQLGGYGIGDYGAGDWGLANSSTITGFLRQWSFDHFGQDLIANPTGGAIYTWHPPVVSPATLVTAAPQENLVVFVMGQAQIVISAGSEALGTLFPTFVRWSDVGDFTSPGTWVASATNQAGSFQLATGSTVVAALAIGLGALIWTDTDLWSMVYQGSPFIFGFNRVGVNVEAMSMRSCVVVGNSVVWPSDRGFFKYDGSGVTPIECSVWDFFFFNIDFSQEDQIFGGRNTLFNEISWWFPFKDGSGIARVKWNYLENVWDFDPPGFVERTAWIDHSSGYNPLGADPTGLLQEHEVSLDADGAPIQWLMETGYYDISDGTEFTFLDRLIPDFLGNWTEAQITVRSADSPLSVVKTYGPYPISQDCPYVNFKVRGRQVSFEFSGNDLGSFLRMGGPRIRTAPAGRR